MALSPNINNLEKDKFKDVSGQTAIAVSVVETVGSGGGDATAANQVLEIAQLTAINTNTDNLPTSLGQAAMAASLPVVLSSDQSPIPVTQSGTWTIIGISGTISLPIGAATLSEQQTQTASLSVLDDWDESDRAKVNIIAGQVGVQGGSGVTNALTQRVVLATDVALPAGTNVIGALSANQSVNVAQMNGVTVTMGSGVTGTGVQRVVLATDVALPAGTNIIGALSANQSVNLAQVNGVATANGFGNPSTSIRTAAVIGNGTTTADFNSGNTSAQTLRVVIATDQSTIPTTPSTNGSATSTLSRTATSTTAATVLASNVARKKAFFVNESATIGGYLKFGTTASATSYSVRMEAKEQYIEEGAGLYTGAVSFILDSGTSNMQVTELTT